MAKKKGKTEQTLNYAAELRLLKDEGPESLYLLWGPEDYLREQYLAALKKTCLPEGDDSFSYKRIDGPALDADELRFAVDAMPFMTERSFVELRDVDINKLKEPEKFISILSDIPDYSTVVIVLGTQYEPDGRLKVTKALRELSHELKFTQQPSERLVGWISRHFADAGKSISPEAAKTLIFVSGDIMSGLLPEIEKIAAYVKGDVVTVADVEAVAHHIPEAVIFDMTDRIAQKRNDEAIAVLGELLADKNNEPIQMLGGLGFQMRRLYAARLAVERRLGSGFLMDACGIKNDFIAKKLIESARGFTLPQLKRAVELCAETDYKIKSMGLNDEALFKETVLRIAAGEEHA